MLTRQSQKETIAKEYLPIALPISVETSTSLVRDLKGITVLTPRNNAVPASSRIYTSKVQMVNYESTRGQSHDSGQPDESRIC